MSALVSAGASEARAMKLFRTILLHVALAFAWVLLVVFCLVVWSVCAAFGWLPRG
jgi:hypothetical protein